MRALGEYPKICDILKYFPVVLLTGDGATMGIFDLFGKKDVKEDLSKPLPFKMRTEFMPYKLHANVRSSASLTVRLKNITGEPVMSSVVVEVPRQLSLDQTGLQKQKELRVGMIAPDEEREARVEIFSDTGTDKGEYTLTITSFIHYRDYGHVLNAMKKRAMLEAV